MVYLSIIQSFQFTDRKY
jgi:hypothetical protein